uniref:hypothetical protein n=1 Tax=Hafnia alvei TaxID=569 RepID=UPI0024A87E00
ATSAHHAKWPDFSVNVIVYSFPYILPAIFWQLLPYLLVAEHLTEVIHRQRSRLIASMNHGMAVRTQRDQISDRIYAVSFRL